MTTNLADHFVLKKPITKKRAWLIHDNIFLQPSSTSTTNELMTDNEALMFLKFTIDHVMAYQFYKSWLVDKCRDMER